MTKPNKRPPAGKRLRAALTEVQESLTGGKPLTMRTVTVRDPAEHSAGTVRALRDKTGLSQASFAKLIGVSPVLVQHWEQGVTTPRTMACRLLDEIARDPAAFMERYVARA